MTAVILVFCAVGFLAAVVPAVDHALSHFCAIAFTVVGGVSVVVVLVVELRDWLRWMNYTRPAPHPQSTEREEAGQQ